MLLALVRKEVLKRLNCDAVSISLILHKSADISYCASKALCPVH